MLSEEINLKKCDSGLVNEALEFFIQKFVEKRFKKRARLKLIEKPECRSEILMNVYRKGVSEIRKPTAPGLFYCGG